jgi:hypothetical protein
MIIDISFQKFLGPSSLNYPAVASSKFTFTVHEVLLKHTAVYISFNEVQIALTSLLFRYIPHLTSLLIEGFEVGIVETALD